MYHHTIRARLINRAKACETDAYSSYSIPELIDNELTNLGHPRARGREELDITSFLESQKDWDLERDHGWSNITDGVLYMFAMLGYRTPTYEVQWLYDEDRVVLDLDDRAILNYRDIPLTCSSQIEGGLMEAIRRLDTRITDYDFLSRLLVPPF